MLYYGIAIGLSIAGLVVIALLMWLSKVEKSSPVPVTVDRVKVDLARMRFAQIANRDSIREARKIANKALKELNQ